MANIITKEDHTYKHFNHAMGIRIEGKKHYEYEMKKRGLIPQEKADDLARKARERQQSAPKAELSQKAREILEAARNTRDKRGNVKLGDRTIEAMKDLGVHFNHPHSPKRTTEKGGWS